MNIETNGLLEGSRD